MSFHKTFSLFFIENRFIHIIYSDDDFSSPNSCNFSPPPLSFGSTPFLSLHRKPTDILIINKNSNNKVLYGKSNKLEYYKAEEKEAKNHNKAQETYR